MKVYYRTRASDLGAAMATSILTEQPADQSVTTGYHQRPASLIDALAEIDAASSTELWEWIAPQVSHLMRELRSFASREVARHRREFRGAYS